jgi:hypothetical protein
MSNTDLTKNITQKAKKMNNTDLTKNREWTHVPEKCN